MSTVRQPAVAGAFYHGQKQVLANDIQTLLEHARANIDANRLSPKAIIVPHAGYIYSGPVAASAYASLYAERDKIKRVVLLGP
ncbi:MAG: AmmeMemoRadiSam system protein B, partial [Gammaproteobacteria bacterium]|nr:AmmeMemoRadiSam system protein B [Gammaproteobacteria bacterium]